MTKKIEEQEDDQPICRDPAFAPVLAHATQMLEHIYEETGGDFDVLEKSHVTLSADFVVDALGLLVDYAYRYEPDFAEIHDDLVEQYQFMNKTESGFGSKTKH